MGMRGWADSGLGPLGHPGAGWQRKRPEELQVLGDAKWARRRLEAGAQERGCLHVKVRVPVSWGSEEPKSLDAQPRGHLPAPQPDGDQGRPSVGVPQDGGRSLRGSLEVSAGYVAFCGVILNNGEIKDPAT